MRYLDAHTLERARGLSIKAKPLSVVLPNLQGKSVLLNLMDTPGASVALARLHTALWARVYADGARGCTHRPCQL
jgi:translation elongation factor EF-4